MFLGWLDRRIFKVLNTLLYKSIKNTRIFNYKPVFSIKITSRMKLEAPIIPNEPPGNFFFFSGSEHITQ